MKAFQKNIRGHSDPDLCPSDPKMGVACRTHQGAASYEVSML